MKNKGFTLAEILVSLGIIGVVAAMTIPSLTANTSAAQIGPKLGKAASVYEQANQALLDEYSVGRLTDTGLYNEGGDRNLNDYIDALSNHFQITPIDLNSYTVSDSGNGTCNLNGGEYNTGYAFQAKDGISYIVKNIAQNAYTAASHRTLIGRVVIDINGTDAPNALGTDVFVFFLFDNGSLKPWGDSDFTSSSYQACHWSSRCQIGQFATAPSTCAGHIFENNLKVQYK